jgi:hypothetical protein
MRNLLYALAIAFSPVALVLPTQQVVAAPSESSTEFCYELGQFGKAVMESRQAGASKQEVRDFIFSKFKVNDETSYELRKTFLIVVDKAYTEPVYRSSADKQKEAERFMVEISMICYKALDD